MSQESAIQRISEGKNVFVTGAGGVGKSWVIKQINDKFTVLCAPTGIAALNIEGATAHSVFGLPIGLPTHKDKITVSKKVRQLFGPESKVKRIIIDEGPMMRADTLELIDRKLKLARQSSLPFGGIQVVVFGDFYQLEPIVGWGEKEHYYKKYESAYCFSVPVWNFETIFLEKVYRQSDERQIAMLNSIRKADKWCVRALEKIVAEAKPYELCKDTLHLCSYKDDAEAINKKFYRRVKGEERTFFAIVDGNKKDKWNEVPVPQTLNLKVGCKVLICANDATGDYVNGDRGTIVGFYNEYVKVQLESTGAEVLVEEFTWEKYQYGSGTGGLTKKAVGTFQQMPLQLGWAVSIHKSQGMTLDNVAIDVGRGCFSAGQFYVALSRVRDLRNLSFVRPVHPNNIIVRQEVHDFYEQCKEEMNND